ncbi:hypothetical protein [Paenibacillus sp. HB172176]|uniref:hypothetical protein n=1 Tax=Paenibacillus sp. HB172176 TaxID=2493690 RepID=UPI001438DD97|nr:hypothetical protein [Paenibacillus sp. HB172176]
MSKTDIWPRPRLNPMPIKVAGVETPRISLNGEDWKLHLEAPADFTDTAVDISAWENVTVPFQVDAGEHEYAYARNLVIPEEWEGNRVLLRFNGANCLARVFVDGKFVRDHYGAS